MKPDLIAALLWDRPTLVRSESQGAREFVDALDLRQLNDSPKEDDPLGLAAHSILAEFSDESKQEALRGYRRLSESTDPGTRLLGLCLLCWSELDHEPTRLAEARAEIEKLDDPLLRARLTTKLIAAAFEYGWDELLPDLFARAREWAPEKSKLRAMIDHAAYNLIGDQWPMDWVDESDPLTEYQWIYDKAAGAAIKTLTQSVEEMARSPWLLSFTIGGAPLNQPSAAEIQARWAGAIWLRTELQTQLAAHLLQGRASSSSEYTSAVTLWALGSGKQLAQIIDFAERHFDEDSADFVVRHLMRSGPVAQKFNNRLLEAAVECWDLISESTATELLGRFIPTQTEHPVGRQVAVLWAVLSLRIPDPWASRLDDLSDDEARAVLMAMTPVVAESIPLKSARRLYELSFDEDSVEAKALPTIAALVDRLSKAEDFEPAEPLPAKVVIDLAWRTSRLVSQEALQKALNELTDDVDELIAEAKRGTAGFGTENPFVTLASAIAKLGQLPRRTRDLLVEAATSSRTARNVRYDAIRVLVMAVAHDALDLKDLPGLIDAIPEAGAESLWPSYSPELVRAAKTELAMAAGEIEDNLPRLLVLSRDPDARVRINAIEAAVLGRRRFDDDMLESILLSGLFDPSSKVIQQSLGAFAELPPTRPAAQAALAERLLELFGGSGRTVRTAIARLVAKSDLPSPLSEVAQKLKNKAEADRSFEVRAAVNE